MAKKEKEDNERTRNWGFVVYEDSAKEDWIEILQSLGIEGAISPCHNKDITSDGELKKAHWHVVLKFDGVKSQKQIEEITGSIVKEGKPYLPVKLHTLKGNLRYLIHMDDPKKYQYKREDVICLGGLDYDKQCLTEDDEQKDCASKMAQIFEIIKEGHIGNFAELAENLIRDDINLFNTFRKNAYFFGQYLKTKRFNVGMEENTEL